MRSCRFIAVIAVFMTLLCATPKLKAQNLVTNFVSDSITYFNQLNDFMTNARDKEGKYFMKEFEIYWFGGYFTETYRQGVYEMSNLMLKKKKKAFPDFRDYLYTVLSFIESEYQTEASFGIWQETVEKMLNNKKRKIFGDYLTFSRGLFEENAIYISNALRWVGNTSEYNFGYDSLPYIQFESLDLTCFAKGDSSVIQGTKGTYYPTTHVWNGYKGKVTWERAGMKPEEVYALIPGAYRINTKKSEFQVDSVIFYNQLYFGNEPLVGLLQEKVLAYSKDRRISYPRFISYDNRLVIKNLEPGVDYEGGFSMHGDKFMGSGSDVERAQLVYYRNGEPFIRAISRSFVIRPDRIAASDAEIRIYLQGDSIYHPGLQMKFFREKRQVVLLRDRKGPSKGPLQNSFHQVDMDVETITWNMDGEHVELGNLLASTNRYALFESANFFNEQRYYDIQGLSDVSPIVAIRNLSIKMDTTHLTVSDLSRFMRISKDQIVLLLKDYENWGLVDFDYGNMEFTIRERLFNYIYGRVGKRDYDVIQFHSEPKSGSNGLLSLLTYDLEIEGVRRILLSDSQQVVIYPAEQKITLKKNRDFNFAGVIKAGRLDFFGKEFSFEYDAFKLNLTNVDSLRLKAETGEFDEMGRPKLAVVKSVIENINGELLIDAPDNKSGYKYSPRYPIFTSSKDSYVYYDKGSIQNGAYKRENFYFHLEPFEIDSLDNFSNAGLRFEGEFVSADIFPEFEEILVLQPDHSLGFVRSTPVEGFPAYRGKGHYYNDIDLSNKGLHGDGKLEYLTSTTISNDFVFLPDSMLTTAQQFEIAEREEGVEFPSVTGEDLSIEWRPYSDVLYAEKIEKPMIFYDGISQLHGLATLRPEGLIGAGLFKFEKAELESKEFVFNHMTFDSDTADFRLLEGTESDKLSFSTVNVNAHVDFTERYGFFKSNGGGSYIDFPSNQYVCFMEEFKWYMDTDNVELAAGEHKAEAAADSQDVRLEGAEFISTHPEQDSLNFFSTLASYDLKNKIITARGVKYIHTADARVYPDSELVVIERKAKMQTFENAGVVANTVTEYHNIYNANINIAGKRSYGGSGYIDYTDENDKTQPIFLERIDQDTTGQTIAEGAIGTDAGFTLNPYFEFRGGVNLEANRQFLLFDGATRISHECVTLPRSWIKFDAEIDPSHVYIPVDTNLEDVGKTDLYASLFHGGDSLGVYTAFLNKRHNYSDRTLIQALGYLTYDHKSGEYRVSNKAKLEEPSLVGNYLSLNVKGCKVYGEGKIDLGVNTGQVKMTNAGNMVHLQTDNEVIADMMMVIDFFFNNNALDQMAETFNKNISLDPVKLDRETYEKGLREILGQESADKLISDLGLYGEFKKFPNELNKSLVLNEVRFKYDPESNSYKSFGKIGVGSIRKEQINKYVEGKIELIRKRSGDVLSIYLEVSSKEWYFFTYSRGIMWSISSSEVFNTAIRETKPDKAKQETSRKEDPYKYMFATLRKKSDFLKRFDLD